MATEFKLWIRGLSDGSDVVAAEPVCLMTSLADAHLTPGRGHGAHVPGHSGQARSGLPKAQGEAEVTAVAVVDAENVQG